MRAGDLIAACNFLEYLRNLDGVDKNLKLYIPLQSIQPSEHCKIMRDYLKTHTDYIITEEDNSNGEFLQLRVIPGTDPTYLDMYNLWNIREDVLIPRQNVFTIPDQVKIDCPIIKHKKLIRHPLLDADYNFERNWPIELLQTLINGYDVINHSYDEYIIVSKNKLDMDVGKFTYCHDYYESLIHISNCETYIGGDTGLSHFASAQRYRPNCYFHYSKNTYGTTNPFHWRYQGNMYYY
jgi:hypothetical protein